MSSATKWFGDLKLAYKYITIFLAILVVTTFAGFIKVCFNRRKLSKAKKAEVESGPRDDIVELNQREKDEGDLFGIRAIEAGFFAGVAQSRPTSRAGSMIEHHSTHSSTLAGNPYSPLMKSHSTNNSMLSLNLGTSGETNSQARSSPLSSNLHPSEAEANGRRSPNGAVDMSLQVPPSPGHPRGSAVSAFGGSDSEGDDHMPRSMSPQSDFGPNRYMPAPTIPMPDALRVSYHSGNDQQATSQAASFNGSPSPSPTAFASGHPPAARLPTLPTTAMRKTSRSPSPESNQPLVRVYEPNHEVSQFSSPVQLQARAYAPTHKRDGSDASSLYSNGNRLSTYHAYQAYENGPVGSAVPASMHPDSHKVSITEDSSRLSVVDGREKQVQGRSSHLSTFLTPTLQDGGKDARLSDFYDAYYRNSHLGPSPAADAKRPVDRKSTIIEVDSPIPSPLLPKSHGPGAAF